MLPSSTSSSSRRPRERRWGVVALSVGLILAALEAALHIPALRAALPARTHFYHPAIARRVDIADQVLKTHGRVDVLFIGSSIVVTNVHPLLFDDLVARKHGEIVSFNAGLAGLWPTSVHLYTEHVWLPLMQPRLVVQGIRYAELAATTHAKNETQVWTGTVEPSWRSAGPITHARAALVSRLHLLQYQGALTRMLRRFRGGWHTPDLGDDEEAESIRGYMPRLVVADGQPDTWEADLPNEGTCAAGRCAVGFEALRKTIAAARRAGARYVLLNVPVHARRWSGPDGVQRYRRYLDTLAAFARVEGVPFVDPTHGDPFRFASFVYSDLAHMTAASAERFTREIAGQLAPLVDAPPRVSGTYVARLAPER